MTVALVGIDGIHIWRGIGKQNINQDTFHVPGIPARNTINGVVPKICQNASHTYLA
jgi:hypothetical protein